MERTSAKVGPMGGGEHASTRRYQVDDDASLATDIHGTAVRPIMTNECERNDGDGDVQCAEVVGVPLRGNTASLCDTGARPDSLGVYRAWQDHDPLRSSLEQARRANTAFRAYQQCQGSRASNMRNWPITAQPNDRDINQSHGIEPRVGEMT